MTKPTIEESMDEKYRQLLEENEKLKAELSEKKTIINRAKDITPVVRPRVNRVFKVLWDVGMGLSRVTDGWILEFGNQFRKFKRLSTVWELLTSDGVGIKDIFINPPQAKRAVISLPRAQPPIDAASTEEKIKLIESYAIALNPSVAQNFKDFSIEQVATALDYYKATIAKGKEIKSATGWLLKCLKEEWYKNFVPVVPAYTPKIFTVADLPEVEVAPIPKNWREMVRFHLPGEGCERVQQRLDNLVPY